MTLSPGAGVEKVEVINDTLLECRGLLYAHGALYVNANNSKLFAACVRTRMGRARKGKPRMTRMARMEAERHGLLLHPSHP